MKKDAGTAAAAKASVRLRCGDCLHYKGTANPVYGERCVMRAVSAQAVAPDCYTPNVGVFRRHRKDTWRVLAALLRNFDETESRVFLGLLAKANRLQRYGYEFLDKVYFVVGEQYLCNFYSGHVMGVGLENTLMIVGSKAFESPSHPMVAHLPTDAVFNQKKFQRIKEQLIKQGKLNDPASRQKRIPKAIGPDYEPPTIDTAQSQLEDALKKRKRKKGKEAELTEEDSNKFTEL